MPVPPLANVCVPASWATLSNVPAGPITSTLTTQVPFAPVPLAALAGTVPAFNCNEVVPATAITVPPHVVDAFAGVATCNAPKPSVGKVSDNETLVNAFAERLLNVTVSVAIVPSGNVTVFVVLLNSLTAEKTEVSVVVFPELAPEPLHVVPPL